MGRMVLQSPFFTPPNRAPPVMAALEVCLQPAWVGDLGGRLPAAGGWTGQELDLGLDRVRGNERKIDTRELLTQHPPAGYLNEARPPGHPGSQKLAQISGGSAWEPGKQGRPDRPLQL